MSVLERCPSYRESNKGSKERQGPTLGVRFREVSIKRESTVKPEIRLYFRFSLSTSSRQARQLRKRERMRTAKIGPDLGLIRLSSSSSSSLLSVVPIFPS